MSLLPPRLTVVIRSLCLRVRSACLKKVVDEFSYILDRGGGQCDWQVVTHFGRDPIRDAHTGFF